MVLPDGWFIQREPAETGPLLPGLAGVDIHIGSARAVSSIFKSATWDVYTATGTCEGQAAVSIGRPRYIGSPAHATWVLDMVAVQ